MTYAIASDEQSCSNQSRVISLLGSVIDWLCVFEVDLVVAIVVTIVAKGTSYFAPLLLETKARRLALFINFRTTTGGFRWFISAHFQTEQGINEAYLLWLFGNHRRRQNRGSSRSKSSIVRWRCEGPISIVGYSCFFLFLSWKSCVLNCEHHPSFFTQSAAAAMTMTSSSFSSPQQVLFRYTWEIPGSVVGIPPSSDRKVCIISSSTLYFSFFFSSSNSKHLVSFVASIFFNISIFDLLACLSIRRQ